MDKYVIDISRAGMFLLFFVHCSSSLHHRAVGARAWLLLRRDGPSRAKRLINCHCKGLAEASYKRKGKSDSQPPGVEYELLLRDPDLGCPPELLARQPPVHRALERRGRCWFGLTGWGMF